MNTTTAAEIAKVTPATVRYWCRYGAVSATKIRGRWNINADSLAARVALTKPKTAELTAENLIAVGGNRWTKGAYDRVYFDTADVLRFAGLEVTRYNTGNISTAVWRGEFISNSQAGKLLGSIDKFWFDLTDGSFWHRGGYSESRVATRDEIVTAAIAAIKTAITEL
jgi:hypothetical protein